MDRLEAVFEIADGYEYEPVEIFIWLRAHHRGFTQEYGHEGHGYIACDEEHDQKYDERILSSAGHFDQDESVAADGLLTSLAEMLKDQGV